MEISARREGGLLVLALAGKMDGLGAQQVTGALQQNLADYDAAVIFDLGGVDYISSAGLRVFQETIRKTDARNGRVAVCGLQEFVEKILKMGGFLALMTACPTVKDAVAVLQPRYSRASSGKTMVGNGWTLTAEHRADRSCVLEVTGNLRKINESGASEKEIHEDAGCSGRYRTGIGAAGNDRSGAGRLAGEMIGLNGALFWVPADGNLAPDFFTAEHFRTSGMKCYSLFHVTFTGPFSDVLRFEAGNPGGMSLTELYTGIFAYARETCPGFSGACAVVIKATVGGIMSRDIRTSLLAAGSNEARHGAVAVPGTRSVMEYPFDRSAIERVSAADVSPRYAGDTMIAVGYCIDPATAETVFPPETLDMILYRSPGAEKTAVFQNTRAAVFRNVPWEAGNSFESQVDSACANGEFVAMHNLLGMTTVKSALVGILPVSSVEKVP